ncbi:type II toxin-antitoxin system RelE/ParE family toxin [Oribacterium sp. NK2B42]|uniref:type II toxin-antitoxin system RelE/ParE family toxin n=1 Tax=Oribacterium sp. NK2B42 TaxID=689781 RepID=UPI000424A367|nr:type II toxin-antitoxin system RelE/ParE family toxin [Oribacterium sp. NK2B42]
MIGNYRVIVTDDVQNDLDNFVYYLLVEKLNEQAAKALLDDYDASIDRLSEVAGSLKHLEDPELSEYRKLRLTKHDYYFLYRVVGNNAIVDRMFHDLQDLDKAMKA